MKLRSGRAFGKTLELLQGVDPKLQDEARKDLAAYGFFIAKDGRRVDPEDIFKKPEKDSMRKKV